MDISKEMIDAMRLRKKDEFNLGSDLMYEDIKLGEIRAMIGYRGRDISKGIKTEEFSINGIKCYKYFKNKESKYLMFNIHGGGFYGGSAEVVEYASKYMADYGDMHVISIEYTLAPESRFPDTMYEIYEIIEEISSDYKDCKIGILGDSAGAHLSMGVSLLDLKNLNILSFVGMFYPVISLIERPDWKLSDMKLDEDSFYAKSSILFLKSIMSLIKRLYLPKEYDISSEYLDLLNIKEETFARLDKVFLAKAQFDYFNKDIDNFGEKFGIKVHEYKGVSHGFIELLSYVEQAKEMLENAVDMFKG